MDLANSTDPSIVAKIQELTARLQVLTIDTARADTATKYVCALLIMLGIGTIAGVHR
jgi:hypothetical protein